MNQPFDLAAALVRLEEITAASARPDFDVASGLLMHAEAVRLAAAVSEYLAAAEQEVEELGA